MLRRACNLTWSITASLRTSAHRDQELSAGGNSQPVLDSSSPVPIQGRFYILGPDNSEHPLAPTNGVYRSIDQAGYLFVPDSVPSTANSNLGNPEGAYSSDPLRTMGPAPGIITDSNGVVYTPTSITDPDGNSISLPNLAYSSNFSSGLQPTILQAGQYQTSQREIWHCALPYQKLSSRR